MNDIMVRQKMLIDLSPSLLATLPETFLKNLINYNKRNIDVADFINNDGVDTTWYSPLPMCLYYLVGLLGDDSYEDFYGADTVIHEDLGIHIMKEMIKAGADFKIKNYYGEDILQCIKEEENGKKTLTTRTKNKYFRDFIKESYGFYNKSAEA